jgi:hypothetical protein
MLKPTYKELKAKAALGTMEKVEKFLLDPTEQNRLSVCFSMDNYAALKAVEEMMK